MKKTEKFAQRAATHWNELNRRYAEAIIDHRWEDANYYAFVCNAIAAKINRAARREIIDTFYDCIHAG